MTDRVRVAAHAKVNLFLRILARETSGYHQIETAFTLLELADELVVTRTAQGVELKAADNAVPRHELHHFATKLGADVAFFASGAPLALAWGRGDRLYRLAPPPAAPALVVVPPLPVATPDAYRWWDELHPELPARGPVVLDAEALASWGSIGRLGGNDFEVAVFGRHPTLRGLYERLAATRPLWVRLSGSGSAVAAVYRNERDRDDAASQLGARDQQLVSTTTRAAPAPAPE